LQKIVDYLKKNGEKLDAEIAAGLGMSLEKTLLQLTELAAKGEVIMCRTTRYLDDKKVEGMLCRVAGYIPPASPGRKPKTPT
jgi:DNA-binding Lrp family transcriptional regulator